MCGSPAHHVFSLNFTGLAINKLRLNINSGNNALVIGHVEPRDIPKLAASLENCRILKDKCGGARGAVTAASQLDVRDRVLLNSLDEFQGGGEAHLASALDASDLRTQGRACAGEGSRGSHRT